VLCLRVQRVLAVAQTGAGHGSIPILKTRCWAVNANNLKQQLEQLHDAIERADHVDEEGRRLLLDLDAHIRELLERSEAAVGPSEADIARGLEDAIRHFEVTHPSLTSALSDLLTALSNAGI
jgi:CII-binding regulator of phage lambda lysogenization HflD